jgi:Flp pilus assembly protein TadD
VRQAELQSAVDRAGARKALLAVLDDAADASAAADAGAALARLALLEGDGPAAALLADRAIAHDSDNARAWAARAIAADFARDWDRAASSHDRAVAMAPHSATARNNRGYSRLLQGRHADAEKDFVAALAIAPDRARIRRNLILALALQGRYADALSKSSPQERTQDLNLLGFAAMARGEDSTASAYFSRARDSGGPQSATADANLAYLAKQRSDQAR